MADYLTGVTFGGAEWIPSFITDLNQSTCIGCGRCFKVCPRNVFDLVEKSVALDSAFDADDEFDDEDGSMVMSIANKDDCIGCEACSRVCPKNCFTHRHKEAA